MAIQDEAQELVDSFDLFEDWEDRYSFLIDMGRSLPPMSEADKTPETKVHGCQSNVWMVGQAEPAGTLAFVADSDSSIVRGLIAVLLQVYSHRTPREILDFDVQAFFREIGFEEHLSMGRRNGLDGMVTRVKNLAATTPN